MSRIVAERLRIHTREIELIPIIEAALEVIRPAAEARQVRVESTLDPSVNSLQGDPDRLQQVILNLLSNAIKFSQAGGRIELRLAYTVTEARIVVKDEGDGISSEFLPYVFDRFKQADSSDIRRHSGLGLGLTIVRRLVELHGGTVAAASDGFEQGSTFTVTLPLAGSREHDNLIEPNSDLDSAFAASTSAG